MRTRQSLPSSYHLAFAVLGLAFLAMFSWVFVQEYFSEWRSTQAEFAALQEQMKDARALAFAAPLGEIKQTWLPDLDRVDRCTTCHLGIDDPTFEAAPQPFATHPGAWLQTHAPDSYGCTVCHGGQGEATDYVHAAHAPIPHWPDPMRPAPLIEANCGRCHRERQPDQAPRLAAGRQVIADAGCVACHEIPGFSGDEVRAPRLDSVGYKIRPDWLQKWLTDPESYLLQSRMPNFRLDEEEIDGLGAFLLSQRAEEPLDSSGIDWSRADPVRGRTVFGEARCVSCHAIDGRGGDMGPELSTVGSKVRREWLFSFLEDPMHDQPATLMLRYRFTDEQIADLVAYLMEDLIDVEADAEAPEVPFFDPGLVETGRQAFMTHGCYSCHALEAVPDAGRIGPSLDGVGDRTLEAGEFEGIEVVPSRANWLYLKLRDPQRLAEESKMPTYDLSELDAARAVIALLSIRKGDLPASRVTREVEPAPYQPQGTVGRLVSRYRCMSCHQVGGWGGELSTVPLDRIGSQLQRSHVIAYLQLPFAIRVSIEERMPRFNMTAEEAETLADYLDEVFVDDALERPFEPDANAARRGAQLYEDLGCRGCHILDGAGGYVGPDLGNTGRRLEPGWMQAWLADPQRWKPGTLQPDYGLRPEEILDLTAYLMTRSTEDGSTP